MTATQISLATMTFLAGDGSTLTQRTFFWRGNPTIIDATAETLNTAAQRRLMADAPEGTTYIHLAINYGEPVRDPDGNILGAANPTPF